MFAVIFDPQVWAAVPFAFWAVVMFVFGSMVGSFLNVCIHRVPLNLSIVTPPSHCPHCKYSIPLYLNVPLFTWLYLRARCRNCGAPISARYFVVELFTGALFLWSWFVFGAYYPPLALVVCLFLAGLVVAGFIDLDHMIIPDGLNFGGMVAGVLCSLVVPDLQGLSNVHGTPTSSEALRGSLLGLAIGAGEIYAVVRLGKLFLGRYRIAIPPDSRLLFTETGLVFPTGEVPYEDIFYRRSDAVKLHARRVELADRCYWNVDIRLTPEKLRIGSDEFDPEQVPHMEAEGASVVLPREAMGPGDIKLMGAIGAFLGWKAVVFSLGVSAGIGALVGIALIALGRRDRSSRLPYGPFIALASAIWVFGGWRLVGRLFGW